ncbi:hypothetical protein U9M48_002391 [Paspalum notatum var. saurae]|uniref:F-box domain-containing protein n=1 Tax=Paspalum notatum var. saurae TaxID=547442 RepID=A0AAQ3PR92_PASNO
MPHKRALRKGCCLLFLSLVTPKSNRRLLSSSNKSAPTSATAAPPPTSGRADAPRLFAGMPPRKKGSVDGGASPEVGGNDDFISALPDDALHHVLSFLPAEDAVRTCVLARRWRDLWKSATGLRIGCADLANLPHVDDIRKFVNHLLLLRKRDSVIYTCEIRFSCNLRDGDTDPYLNLWIRHVLDRGVRVLRLEIENEEDPGLIDLDDLPLASQHLRTLELEGVALNNRLSNFLNCPNLQHLEIGDSVFSSVDEISSESLKCLGIGGYCFFYVHTRICTPNLVSLWLDAHFRRSVPVLGSMPSLKKAFVRNTTVMMRVVSHVITVESLMDMTATGTSVFFYKDCQKLRI